MTSQRRAILALCLSCFFWGAGFTWAKAGGQAVNHAAGLPDGAMIGPVYLLAIRFLLSGVVWIILFPQARQGWTWASVGRSSSVGILCASALIFQHLGLDRTSEAVSAFLTSLTVVGVPLVLTLLFAKPPRATIWLAVAVATLGIWLMTGATPGGFGLGELLGLGCAISYSFEILAVNWAVGKDSSWRISGGMFLIIGLICLIWAIVCHTGDAVGFVKLATAPGVAVNAVLLAVFGTLLAFGAMTHFQPRLDPTQASILYLLEPIFASAFAWIFAGKSMGIQSIIGGLLILSANLIVELLAPVPHNGLAVDVPARQA